MTDTSPKDTEHGAAGNLELRSRLKRAALLRHLLETYHSDEDPNPHDAPLWEAWLAQSGELPPDFDAMPSNAFLPDLLTFAGGQRVTSPEAWQRRRDEIWSILEYWQLGHCPPAPPKMVVEEGETARCEDWGGTLQRLCLVYAPSAKAVLADAALAHKDLAMYRTVRLNVQLFIPDGEGPFPAIVDYGFWEGGRLMSRLAATAAQRGYVVCLFEPQSAFSAKDVYAGYDCNELVWWAYAASRCVDYLWDRPEVDCACIAAAGHSRGGKLAVLAAAYDERFAACIASHPGGGSGSAAPWRYLGEKYGAEHLEYSTRCYPYWNHPRLRFFAGRENKLPFDSHFWLSLVAPRPLLIGEGEADDVDECWGGQQAYLATKPVYELLGQPGSLNIVFHPGGHSLSAEALHRYVDWLDMRFGRRPLTWRDELMYTYTFEQWRQVTGEQIDVTEFPEQGLDDLLTCAGGSRVQSPADWPARREEARAHVLSMVGELPAVDPAPAPALVDVRESRLGLIKAERPLGGGLIVHLTYPSGPGPFPVALYLHAYIDALGWNWSEEYGWMPSVGERLAQQGFLAVEYDQFGYGARNREAGIEFFAAHPQQSAMGVMVQDVRRVIDAITALPIADPERVVAAGFSLGGAVALHAAALDERIKAVASTCGFASLRLDAHGLETEGLKRYSHLRPTLPRLGFFVGQERRVPYDYHELLALIAPRPVLVLAPLLDQDFRSEDVRACCEAAAPVYRLLGAPDALCFEAPNDFNRYHPAYQQRVNAWLARQVGTAAAE